MIRNYIKIACRNLSRHKAYTLINLTGLAVGMAAAILIFLWVRDELSFDRFHEFADTTYRVEFDQDYSGRLFHVTVEPWPMAPALDLELPEVAAASRYTSVGDVLARAGDRSFYENRIRYVDPAFFEIFTFPLISGDLGAFGRNPKSVIMTRSQAEKYFGKQDPVGKSLTINNRDDFTVVGVMEDVPPHSSLRFDMLIPVEFLADSGIDMTRWSYNTVPTYVRLHPGGDPRAVAEKIRAMVARNQDDGAEGQTYSLMPLTRIHLHAHFGFVHSGGGDQAVVIFSVVALFVLLIASVNFMNLSTARASTRAMEVGLRKLVGARRGHLIRQFYGESMLQTAIALAGSLLLVRLLLPVFNALVDKQLALSWHRMGGLGLALLGITILTGLVSGSYPALFLSAFQPASVFKGARYGGARGAGFRRALVVLQFALSVLLMIGTGIVSHQLDFLMNRDPGYALDQVVYFPIRNAYRDRLPALEAAWERLPTVAGVTSAVYLPTGIHSNTDNAVWEGRAPDLSLSTHLTWVDYDFFSTLNMKFVEGRPFSPEMATDGESAFVINEEMRRIMGKGSAAGARFGFGEMTGTVIGVVRNFHFESLRARVQPLVIQLQTENNRWAMVRLRPGNLAGSIEDLEAAWRGIVPEAPFDYRFLDHEFEVMYRSEARMRGVLRAFSGLAVMIACLGLFGLASYLVDRRRKEIGIRKTLGSSSREVVGLLTRQFLRWVLAANVIAWPLAWGLSRSWLGDFAYRASLPLGVFIMAGGLSLLVALLAVGWRAVRAAATDPADALRYE